MDKGYGFVVSNRQDVDFSRIYREAVTDNAGAVGVIVLVKDRSDAVIMLSRMFLNKFNKVKVTVMGERLSGNWGYERRPEIGPMNFPITTQEYKGVWRTLRIPVHMIPAAVREIQAAKKLLEESITINVVPV